MKQGLINKSLSFVEEKAEVSKAAIADMRVLKPYFYDEEDYAEFLALFKANVLDRGNRANVEIINLPYTYHKPVYVDGKHLKSDEILCAIMPNLNMGFARLGVADTYIRPNVLNVLSCQKVGHACRAENGNLGYIANPYWATYVIFNRGDSAATVALDQVPRGLEANKIVRKYPNPIAAINVMLGASTRSGRAVAVFSNVFGDIQYACQHGGMTNLALYFMSQGYEIKFTQKFLQQNKLDYLVLMGMSIFIEDKKTNKYKDKIVSGLFAPSIKADVFAEYSKDKPKVSRVMPYRYHDVDPPFYCIEQDKCFECIKTVGEIRCSTLINLLGPPNLKQYKVTSYEVFKSVSGTTSFATTVLNFLQSDKSNNAVPEEAQKSSETRFWSRCVKCGKKIELGYSSCIVYNEKHYCEAHSNGLSEGLVDRKRPRHKFATIREPALERINEFMDKAGDNNKRIPPEALIAGSYNGGGGGSNTFITSVPATRKYFSAKTIKALYLEKLSRNEPPIEITISESTTRYHIKGIITYINTNTGMIIECLYIGMDTRDNHWTIKRQGNDTIFRLKPAGRRETYLVQIEPHNINIEMTLPLDNGFSSDFLRIFNALDTMLARRQIIARTVNPPNSGQDLGPDGLNPGSGLR